jgi:hypothetical protein
LFIPTIAVIAVVMIAARSDALTRAVAGVAPWHPEQCVCHSVNPSATVANDGAAHNSSASKKPAVRKWKTNLFNVTPREAPPLPASGNFLLIYRPAVLPRRIFMSLPLDLHQKKVFPHIALPYLGDCPAGSGRRVACAM